MMAWSRTRTFIAGAALILAANAVAVVGVIYNRSGEADSLLKLSQRELQLPYGWGLEGESSGIALTLRWRVPVEEVVGARVPVMSFQGGAPAWLDKGKLAALGFDVSQPEDTDKGRMHFNKQLAREALLVLELDGPAYRQSLERVRQYAEREEALHVANPGNKEFVQRAEGARKGLEQEERVSSRLFLVDAGPDAAALRAKYPDRAGYAIVRGQVRPWVIHDKTKSRLSGRITPSVGRINVPYAFRPVFEPLLPDVRRRRSDAEPPFAVAVAFGQRLEPWITAASGNSAAK
jgi:hypothetical protein